MDTPVSKTKLKVNLPGPHINKQTDSHEDTSWGESGYKIKQTNMAILIENDKTTNKQLSARSEYDSLPKL